MQFSLHLTQRKCGPSSRVHPNTYILSRNIAFMKSRIMIGLTDKIYWVLINVNKIFLQLQQNYDFKYVLCHIYNNDGLLDIIIYIKYILNRLTE